MAKGEKAKAKAKPKASRPKNDSLVTWKIEWFPATLSQNKMYTDKLVNILDKRIRRTPLLYATYNHGRLASIGQSDQGISKLKGQIIANKNRASFDRFAIYTLAKRRQLNDLEALATHIAWPQKSSGKNFVRAKNLGDHVRKDVRAWSSGEARKINRTLRPLERRYARSMKSFDKKETRIRKTYLKRIDKAKDKNRQRHLRAERDRKLKVISNQRKRLQPWRNAINSWNAKLKVFQNTKI